MVSDADKSSGRGGKSLFEHPVGLIAGSVVASGGGAG